MLLLLQNNKLLLTLLSLLELLHSLLLHLLHPLLLQHVLLSKSLTLLHHPGSHCWTHLRATRHLSSLNIYHPRLWMRLTGQSRHSRLHSRLPRHKSSSLSLLVLVFVNYHRMMPGTLANPLQLFLDLRGSGRHPIQFGLVHFTQFAAVFPHGPLLRIQ